MELLNNIGYSTIHGADVERDYKNPLYENILVDSLHRLNPNLPENAINEALQKLHNFDNNSLVKQNLIFMDYLQNGITVKYLVDNEERSGIVYLVDCKNITNNSFIAANQWTFTEYSTKRPDIILFLNGLPLVLIELKSPSRENTDASEGYLQIRNYMHEIPSIFIYNAICVISDQITSKAGTITANEDRFMEWKTTDGNYENTQYARFDTFFIGMFQPERFLDIIKNFICFSSDGTTDIKILAAYHQYFAVKKAINSTEHAIGNDGKGGVFWHTQGSGKSLSMIFYAHLLQETVQNPTIVIITDRNDLDNQLYGQFARCKNFLRQEPLQAESREHLKTLLAGRKANGIIFTTMQKFEESEEPLSIRENIVVIADEAHRSQYGLAEKIKLSTNDKGQKVARRIVGTARIIRNSLPNATYIGFTGTPISSKDRNTREVFGNYIDIYDMTQSVEDGATRPIYYESRVIKLNLDKDVLKLIDQQYDLMANNADPEVIEKSKRELGKMEAILGNDKTIESLTKDVIDHYENFRANLLTGKAMIVAYSRPIAIKIYNKILELRPKWQDKVNVVMTSENTDPEEWHKIISNKHRRDELATKFKNDDDEFKIAIVVDMWLTGFDVPFLDTMYIDKPIQRHTLIQTISRVNRVYKGKTKGLIVDYIGIKNNLDIAINEYTNFNVEEIEGIEQSVKIVKDQLDVLNKMFHKFNDSDYFNGTPKEQLKCLNRAVEYVQLTKNLESRFMRAVKRLKEAFNLCVSNDEISDDEKDRIHFFLAIRSILFKLTKGDVPDISQMNKRVQQMIEDAIQSDGIEELFETNKPVDVDILSDEYLSKIAQMKLPNTKIKILQRLLSQAIEEFRRVNKIKGVEFAKRLKNIVDNYNERNDDIVFANEVLDDVADQLMNLLQQLKNEKQSFKDMGIDFEEKAFFDILAAVAEKFKFEYPEDKMIALSKRIKLIVEDKAKYADWSLRDDIKANLQVDLILALDEYGYPPVTIDDVYKDVLEQAENFRKYQN